MLTSHSRRIVRYSAGLRNVSFHSFFFHNSYHFLLAIILLRLTLFVVFALIIALGQATVYVLTGQPKDIGAGICLLGYQSLLRNQHLWIHRVESIFSYYCQHLSWLRIQTCYNPHRCRFWWCHYSPSLQIFQVPSALVFLWLLRSFTAVSYLLFFVPFALIPNGLMNIILVIDCEIGMHEAGGPEMAAFQDLL